MTCKCLHDLDTGLLVKNNPSMITNSLYSEEKHKLIRKKRDALLEFYKPS